MEAAGWSAKRDVPLSEISLCSYYCYMIVSILLTYPRADAVRARVLIPPRLFTPGETKALAKSKVHQ